MLTLTSPFEIWAHRLPAGLKLAALAGATVGLFALDRPLPLALATLAVASLSASGGMTFTRAAARMLMPLWPFVLIVALWHLWLRDIPGGAVVLLRMLSAVALANFVTMTTRLSDMLALFQRLLSPLAALGLSPKALGLAIALFIRFIPVMLQRMAVIAQAWRARSPRRPGWRLMMPATLSALDDAEHVAEALRARGGAD